MIVHDELTGEVLSTYDLEKGYLIEGEKLNEVGKIVPYIEYHRYTEEELKQMQEDQKNSLQAQIEQLQEQNNSLLECILEMSEMIYNG